MKKGIEMVNITESEQNVLKKLIDTAREMMERGIPSDCVGMMCLSLASKLFCEEAKKGFESEEEAVQSFMAYCEANIRLHMECVNFSKVVH